MTFHIIIVQLGFFYLLSFYHYQLLKVTSRIKQCIFQYPSAQSTNLRTDFNLIHYAQEVGSLTSWIPGLKLNNQIDLNNQIEEINTKISKQFSTINRKLLMHKSN